MEELFALIRNNETSQFIEKVRHLMSTENFNINGKGEDDVTYLMVAAMFDRPRIVQFLLDNNANTEIRNNRNQNALSLSVLFNSVSSMKILLHNGANPNIKFGRNDTLLFLSIYNSSELDTVVELLKFENVDINFGGGDPVLMVAIFSLKTRVIKSLLRRGADFTERLPDGFLDGFPKQNRTALEMCVVRKYTEGEKILREHMRRELLFNIWTFGNIGMPINVLLEIWKHNFFEIDFYSIYQEEEIFGYRPRVL